MFEEKISENICCCTAVTEVFPGEQRVTALILEYDRGVRNESLSSAVFEVEDHFKAAVYPAAAVHTNGGVLVSQRNVTRVYANNKPELSESGRDGRYIILELDPDDPAAPSLYVVGEHRACRSYMKDLKLIALQKDPIISADGDPIPVQKGVISSKTKNLVADDFIQAEFEGLQYSLYIPDNYDGSRSFPLVQFIADSWDVGPHPTTSLAQGWGGIVWAFPEEQAKRPCFVLCPHFPGPTIIEDDYSTRPELDTAIGLFDHILEKYNIDRNRVYHTGQSMGAMSGFEWACRRPDHFTALLLLSGTGDPDKIGRLADTPIWLLASSSDGRGAAILKRTADTIEQAGGTIGRHSWDGKLDISELNRLIRSAAGDGSIMHLTLFEPDSVVPENMPKNGGGNHRGTWVLCYRLEALREWLFTQTK